MTDRRVNGQEGISPNRESKIDQITFTILGRVVFFFLNFTMTQRDFIS
jgi:hypothetical protein